MPFGRITTIARCVGGRQHARARFEAHHGQRYLLEIIGTLGSPSRFARRLHGRQQQRYQDANDGNDGNHHSNSTSVKPREKRIDSPAPARQEPGVVSTV